MMPQSHDTPSISGAPGPGADASRTVRWLRAAAGVLVALLFLYFTLHRLDWPAVRAAWRSAAPALLVLAVVALAAGYTVRIARWWAMLRVLEPEIAYGDCVRPFLVSIAVNNTVPLRAGDFVRAFGFRRTLRAPAAAIVGTLVIERVLDLLVLLALFFVGLLGVAHGSVPRGFIASGKVLFGVALSTVLALVFAPRAVERVVIRLLLAPISAWRGPAAPAAGRLRAAAEQILGTFTRLLTPARAAGLLALSIVAWGLEGGVYAAVAWALHSGGAAFGPLFSLATGTLATLLPSSPGYVGTFDYFAVLGLVAYGATRTAGAAFALLTHFVLWLPPTLAGTLCLVWGRRRDGTASLGNTRPELT